MTDTDPLEADDGGWATGIIIVTTLVGVAVTVVLLARGAP